MNDIKGYALAAEQFDRQEPPDGSARPCGNCGEKREDHVFGGRKYGAEWKSELGVCPDEATGILDTIRDNEFQEPDEEAEREHAIESQRREW